MGCHENDPEISSAGSEERMRRELLASALRPIITDFLDTLNYEPPPKANTDALRAEMLKYAASSGVPYTGSKHAHQCFMTGLSVAADMYPSQPLETQLHIGLFTWLGFLIDDDGDDDDRLPLTGSSPGDGLALFQSRFTAGQPQPAPLLARFAEVLRRTYAHWDPVVANLIVLSALAFVSANAMTARGSGGVGGGGVGVLGEMPAPRVGSAGAAWAYHFRNMEGLPEVYTYFMFPAASCPEVGVYLQAVPDMGRFINLTNDILSFYKEEVAGETRNYINSVATYEGKTAMAVLRQVKGETAQAYLRATEILSGTGQYERAWQEYVMGYVKMHLNSSRYRFGELGLDDRFLSN